MTWLFPTLGWTLGALAVLLLAWSLFWDRARGRRRCPKCWYDMSGAGADDGGAFRCPECGCVARTERRLRRTRRRKRLALLAIPLFLAAYGAGVTPGVVDRGWPAAVPTTVLVAMSPWITPADHFTWTLGGNFGPDSWQDHLFVELYEERIENDALWPWQHRAFAYIGLLLSPRRIGLNGDYSILLDAAHERGHIPDPLEERLRRRVYLHIETRAAWPSGAAAWYRTRLDRWRARGDTRVVVTPRQPGLAPIVVEEEHGGISGYRRIAPIEWTDRLTRWSVVPPQILDHAADVEVFERIDGAWRPLTAFTYTFEFGVADLPDILTPVESDEVVASLKEVSPPLLLARGGQSAFLAWEPDHEALEAAGVPTLALDFEVRYFDEPRYRGQAWWSSASHKSIGDYVVLAPTGDAMPPEHWSDELGWTVHLSPNPTLALRNLDAGSYWSGECLLPVEWQHWPTQREWLARRIEALMERSERAP